MQLNAAWMKRVVATGVVVLGMAVGAWAESMPGDGEKGRGDCSGSTGGEDHGPLHRPRAFEPHVVGIAGAMGFAVNGCFPGECGDPVTVTQTQGSDCPTVADDLKPCANRAMENFGIDLRIVSHPPLTPDEKQEQCGCSGDRKRELDEKEHRGRDVRHEVRMTVNVGTGFFVVDHFEIQANDAEAGQAAHCTRLGDTNILASGWRPWLKCFTPIKLVAQLRAMGTQPGAEPAGSLELSFNRHQMRPCAFGWVRLAGHEPLWVMATANWYHGRAPRPAWHCWCKPGHEEDGQWSDEPGQGPDCPKPTPSASPVPPPAPTQSPGTGGQKPPCPTALPTATPKPTETPKPTPTPQQPTVAPKPTETPKPTPTPQQPTTSPTPCPTVAPKPTETPKPTPTPQEPTTSPTPCPTVTPKPTETPTPTPQPTQTPTPSPTPAPGGNSGGDTGGNTGGSSGGGKGNGNDHGNNGVGNGTDPQPPGNPPVNDGPGTGPGNPGNKGGNTGSGTSSAKSNTSKGVGGLRKK